MNKVFTILLITCFFFITATNSAYCQSNTGNIHEDVDKVYVNPQIKPSFAMGADSLNNYLTLNINTSLLNKSEECIVKFIVSSRGMIYQISIVNGNCSFIKELKSALLKSSGQWKSGMQHNYPVNAFCNLKITTNQDGIIAVIQ